MSNALHPAMRTHHESPRPPPVIGLQSAPRGRRMDKRSWIDTCSLRLSAPAPELGQARCDSVAANLWEDVSEYDPSIAAEMEYESGV